MAQECGFFNAQLVGEEYDRVYLAEQFAAYFASFIGNGVFGSSMQQLKVLAQDTANMSVKVGSGQAWINGWWYRNTDAYTLDIDVANGTLSRIDLIVLRWGQTERDMWLQVIKGKPSANPVAPSISRGADYYDLQLATVSIPAGAIKITQAQITDTRLDNSVCGLVTGVVDQIDTTTLFNQFESYFDEFKQLSASEFDTWFESVKGKLSGDIAGSLQNQIDNLDMQLSNQLANIGKTVYPVGSIYISVANTSPASLFGGTWERLKDRFLLAAGDSYAAGSTGGEATHTLTASEMPSHNHAYSNATGVQGHQLTVNEMPRHTHGIHWVGATPPQGGGSDQNFGVTQVAVGNQQSGSAGGNGSHSHGLSKANANTTNAGSGSAHNNMPPYLAVYAWKRVA